MSSLEIPIEHSCSDRGSPFEEFWEKLKRPLHYMEECGGNMEKGLGLRVGWLCVLKRRARWSYGIRSWVHPEGPRVSLLNQEIRVFPFKKAS